MSPIEVLLTKYLSDSGPIFEPIITVELIKFFSSDSKELIDFNMEDESPTNTWVKNKICKKCKGTGVLNFDFYSRKCECHLK